MAPKVRIAMQRASAAWHSLPAGYAREQAKGAGGGGPRLPPADMLQDLCSRFVLNCPEEELQSFERILFLVEQARRAGCERRPAPTLVASLTYAAPGALVLRGLLSRVRGRPEPEVVLAARLCGAHVCTAPVAGVSPGARLRRFQRV